MVYTKFMRLLNLCIPFNSFVGTNYPHNPKMVYTLKKKPILEHVFPYELYIKMIEKAAESADYEVSVFCRR